MPPRLFAKKKNKILHLHIGCGKTGSSALQLWLANNARSLSLAGIHYPLFSMKAEKLGNYSITSGNGVAAVAALQSEDCESFFEPLLNKNNQVLLSSETFQTVTVSQLRKLKDLCDANDVYVNVIVYLRDLYDIAYSSYVQGIKRHNFRQPFSERMQQFSGIQQLDVLQKYEQVFENINVMHYDHEKKRGLEHSFCGSIGIKTKSMTEMSNHKVNRSLTVKEIQLLRLANQIYFDLFNDIHSKFCVHISDFLIASRPELETEILYEPAVEALLAETYQEQLNKINTRYLSESKLCIFERDGKCIIETEPEVNEETQLFIIAMIKSFHRLSQVKNDKLYSNLNAIQPTDTRLPEVLRDEAIKREETDLETAYCLMHSAATFRPDGPVINKRLKNYSDKLGFAPEKDDHPTNTSQQ